MPVETLEGEPQGAGPLVTVTLKTFLPDGRGEMVPEIEHPAFVPVKLPFEAIVTLVTVPSRPVSDQLPVISDSTAGVA